MFSKLAKIFSPKKVQELPNVENINTALCFNVMVVEFMDNADFDNGKALAYALKECDGLNIGYYGEYFDKSFLNLESRNLFDLIDKGHSLINQTGADILVWGYRQQDHIRLNFQTKRQYENRDHSFVGLLDCLYIPASALSEENFSTALKDLIHGAIISAVNKDEKEYLIYRKYLLKKIISRLSNIDSSTSFSLEHTPYIMNFLGIIYMSLVFESTTEEDFKVTKTLFEKALKHQNMLKQSNHLGCIYYHLGQLYDCAAKSLGKKSAFFFKGALENYRLAQKFLSKYSYPYDYGYICYKLSNLYVDYWKQTEDLQALRDAVFQLREAEKIYTQVLFPNFWAHIQGLLGYMLHNLGHITRSVEIGNLAVSAYKSQQKIVTEKNNPALWAEIQLKVGEIYHQQGRTENDIEALEEALSCFHDALYIFESRKNTANSQKTNINIAKTYQVLAEIKSE